MYKYMCACKLMRVCVIHSFVDSDTKVDNYEFPSLSILCSSSLYHKYLKVTSHIYHPSIFLLDDPPSFFPPLCPLVSVNVTNHSTPSVHVPHIPFSSLSCPLGNATRFATQFVLVS